MEAVILPSAKDESWSRSPSASLKEPLPSRAMTAEVEALAAADNRRQDLVLLGGGEHEDDVLGRLFEHLEEGVEGLGREHVDLVYDVDLHPAGDWGKVHLVSEVPYLIYPPVGGRVHLENVHRGVAYDGPAALASPVGLRRRPLLAVEAHREHLRRARLPRPPGTRE